MSDTNNSAGGIGLLGVLGIAFVTLKLLGVIDWSWWHVTLPFWGVGALALAVCGVFFLAAGFLRLMSRIFD